MAGPRKPLSTPNLWRLLLSIIVAESVGLLSGLLSGSYSGIYQALQKPSFAPPAWVFGIVWPLLFLLMGVASYRIWERGFQDKEVREKSLTALWVYGTQLILNFWWSIIYFRLGLRGWAFLELLVLLVFIVITTIKFYRLDRTAGLLLLPYLIWVSFAAVLNYATWILNR